MNRLKFEERRLLIFWFISVVSISLGIVVTNYLSLIALGIFVLALVLFKPDDLFALLFGLMPFANIFKLSANSTSFFTICEILLVFIYFFKHKVKSSFLASIVVLVVYIFTFSLDSFEILTVLKVVCGFFLIYYSVHIYTQKGVWKTVHLLALSTVCMLLLTSDEKYVEYVEPYFMDLNFYIDESTGHATETMRTSGFFGDPNYCSVLLIMTVSLLCVLYYHKHIGNIFWFYTVMIISFGLFTYSKSFFLCVVLTIVFLIFFVLFPKHQGWALISVIAVGVMTFLVLNGQIPVIDMVVKRFSSDDLTTGRSELNIDYIKYIINNAKVLYLGEGISIERYSGSANNVHNLYIELFYKMGLFGTSLYLATLVTTFLKRKQVGRKAKRHIVNYLPLFFFLILFAFLAGILNYALPFYIIIVYLGLNYQELKNDISERRISENG